MLIVGFLSIDNPTKRCVTRKLVQLEASGASRHFTVLVVQEQRRTNSGWLERGESTNVRLDVAKVKDGKIHYVHFLEDTVGTSGTLGRPQA